MNQIRPDTGEIARKITRSASFQTFWTIRLLADRDRVADAYRAYAYFRWFDDRVDTELHSSAEREAFVARQRSLIERCYAGDPPQEAEREETVLVDLIRNHPRRPSPLATYIENMLAVMAFDSARRGRLVSRTELASYEHALAVAVTEAMHYFIAADKPAPRSPERYLAVKAAHITHMLRDTHEDIRAGYFNVPAEFLRAHASSASDASTSGYRAWIEMRVALARRYFMAGRRYFRQVPSARCRLAAYAYTARFELVLDLIERDGFVLRPEYGARKGIKAGLRMAGSVVASTLGRETLSPEYHFGAPDEIGGD